jgi:hypothetical protein
MKKVTWIVSVVFLASIFLTGYGGINECFAAQAKKAVSKKTAQGQEQKKVFDAHDTNVRYHFNDTDMERALKSRSLLKKAGALFDSPLEYFEIPFEGTVLTGYFRRR